MSAKFGALFVTSGCSVSRYDIDIIMSVLPSMWPVQITCYGNGEDATQPEGSGGELQQYMTEC